MIFLMHIIEYQQFLCLQRRYMCHQMISILTRINDQYPNAYPSFEKGGRTHILTPLAQYAASNQNDAFTTSILFSIIFTLINTKIKEK